MSDLGIDPDGAAAGRWLACDVGARFLQLLTEPAATVTDHEEIPSTRGIYLFSEGDRAVKLGLGEDLGRALRAAVNPDARDGSTYLSFHLARWMAKTAGLDVAGERRRLEADREFLSRYRRAKETVPRLHARFLTHWTVVERQVLALFSEVHLDAPIPSRLYPEWEGPASFPRLESSAQDDPPCTALTAVADGCSVATLGLEAAPWTSLDLEDADELNWPPEPSKAQLGRAIRQIRNERGLTQEQVADRTSIHATYLSFHRDRQGCRTRHDEPRPTRGQSPFRGKVLLMAQTIRKWTLNRSACLPGRGYTGHGTRPGPKDQKTSSQQSTHTQTHPSSPCPRSSQRWPGQDGPERRGDGIVSLPSPRRLTGTNLVMPRFRRDRGLALANYPQARDRS